MLSSPDDFDNLVIDDHRDEDGYTDEVIGKWRIERERIDEELKRMRQARLKGSEAEVIIPAKVLDKEFDTKEVINIEEMRKEESTSNDQIVSRGNGASKGTSQVRKKKSSKIESCSKNAKNANPPKVDPKEGDSHISKEKAEGGKKTDNATSGTALHSKVAMLESKSAKGGGPNTPIVENIKKQKIVQSTSLYNQIMR